MLRQNGLFGIIVANKWMRANYGLPLRQWLKQRGLIEIIYFGDLPVFEQATAYPSILRLEKTAPKTTFWVTIVKTLYFSELTNYVTNNRYLVQHAALTDKSWSLVEKQTQALLDKLHQQGIPLHDYVENPIYRGILTGLNQAFVIDAETRQQLIADDPNSTDLIKPFLIGRDIKRYQPPKSERYFIFTRRGVDIKKYPAIKHYLLQYQKRLMPKPPDWSGEWVGRKPGSYEW